MTIKQSDIPTFETELLEYIQGQIYTAEIRPAGFGITAGEYRAKIKPSPAFSTARRQLNGLVESGKLKSKTDDRARAFGDGVL